MHFSDLIQSFLRILILALGIVGFLIYAARGITERGGALGFWGLSLVLGGALGNIVDRLRFGRVIDFLDFRVWPVFNIADSAVTVGTVALMIGLWWKERTQHVSHPA